MIGLHMFLAKICMEFLSTFKGPMFADLSLRWRFFRSQGPLVHNFADHVMAGFDFRALAGILTEA